MSNPQPTPSLDRPAVTALPTRALRSPYFPLRTPFGGFYLDPQYNQNLVRRPDVPLAQFLARAERVALPSGETEVRYTVADTEHLQPLRYLHEGAIQQFEQAAESFWKGQPGMNQDQITLRQGFKLPDPSKEPDAYWVTGERFSPELLILWGCEQEEKSSLSLLSAVKMLRERVMSWTRLFREGVELARLKDPVGVFLAFPVLGPDGKLTHLDRLVNGQYVREPVQSRWYECWKARPLKRLPAAHIRQFQTAAENFYRPVHPPGCSCAACRKAGPSASPAAAAPAQGLSYEQELRQGFRLPDPDQRPDVYFVYGRPLSGHLLVLCPHPGVKDPEEMDQMLKDLQWAKGKARTAQDNERVQELSQAYQQDLAVHTAYRKYFYTPDESLPLTADEVLGFPKPAPKPSASPGALAPPNAAAAAPAEAASETVAGKLWKRRIEWGKLAARGAVVLGAIVLAAVAVNFFWPKHLAILSAAVSNDAALDPDNRRNVIEVQFNNRLGRGVLSAWTKARPARSALGEYSLLRRADAKAFRLREPQADTADPKRVVLSLDLPDVAFEEGTNLYVLNARNARDIWGNELPALSVPLVFGDTRPPQLIGDVVPASDDAEDGVVLRFNEPLDKASAETPGDYALSGPGVTAVKSAQLQKDERSVVVRVEKAFESGQKYALTIRNVAHAAQAKQYRCNTTTNFVYAQVPLRLSAASAAESQLLVKLEFNKRVDPVSARTAFKLDKNLQIGAVVPLDDRTLQLVLSNSFLAPNEPYTLRIDKLKDPLGKPGSELSATQPVSFSGVADTNVPAVTTADSRGSYLDVVFNKDLREDTARKPEHYSLFVRSGDKAPWLKQPVARIELRDGKVARLWFPAELDRGTYKLEYKGVEDLVGHKTDAAYTFLKSGPNFNISCMQGIRVEGKTIRFRLDARIDQARVTKSNFALVEDNEQGALLAGLAIEDVKLNLSANSTEIVLATAGDLDLNRAVFKVRCLDLKVLGDARLQDPEPCRKAR